MTETPRPPEPFPRHCSRCGRETVVPVTIDFRTTMRYEGRAYEVEVASLEVQQCGDCGQRLFDVDAGGRISAAFRAKLGLLHPDQIRAGRKALGLTQEEFASHLGVAEESISRWETGVMVQSRVVDRQIRLYFQLPAIRTLLGARETPDFGTAVRFSASESSAVT